MYSNLTDCPNKAKTFNKSLTSSFKRTENQSITMSRRAVGQQIHLDYKFQ